jgi:hypothetical protein
VSAVTEPATVTEQERRYLMARRQAIIIDLGAIEDYLGLERSIVPRRKREPRPPEELRDRFDRMTARREVN